MSFTSSVQPVILSKTYQNQITLPLVSSLSIPQQKGSLIWDPRLQSLYISDGSIWQYIPPGSISIQDLFSVLTVGNFTGGLDIDLTSGSNIVSSDGDIILNTTLSAGSGNILLNPKVGSQVNVNGDMTVTGLLTSEGNIDTVAGSEIVSSDGDILIDTTSSSGNGKIILIPKGGPNGLVVVDGSLLVTGNTTALNTETFLIRNNTVYINNGNILTTPLPGFVVVNYLPTVNNSNVIAPGFTMGSIFAPTVQTDGAFGFSPGDIIQISSANDPDNDGLFEVDSNVAGLITIRGIGGVPPTFDMFQKNFTTDATVAGLITLVNITAASSGSDGLWEVSSPGSSTTGMTFRNLALELQDSGTGTYSFIFDAPSSILKMLSAGIDISIVDSGTGNLTISNTASHINSSGAGSTSLVFNATTNTLNDLFGGTGITLSSVGGRITITNTAPNITSVGTGTSLVFSSPANTIKSIAQGTDISIVDNAAGTLTINNTASHINSSGAGSTSLVFNSTTNTLNDLFGGTGITLSSAAGRVTITNTAPNITSVGTGTSLVFSSPANTIKSIAQGTNITITDNGAGTLTITGATPSGPYQQVGSLISPISASVNAIVAGQTNTIATVTNSFIGGGTSNSISNAGANDAIVGGSGNIMNTGTATGCFIGAGSSNSFTLNAAAVLNYSTIVAGQNNVINVPGAFTINGVAIIGGNTNIINCNGNSSVQHAIVGGGSNTISSLGGQDVITGGGGNNITIGTSNGCFISSGSNNNIIGNAASTNNYSGILCGQSNTINVPGAGLSVSGNVIAGGVSHTITCASSSSSNNIIAGGSSHTINSSNGQNAIVGGTSHQISTSGSNGCFIGGGSTNIISGNADGTSVNSNSSIISGSTNTITTPASGATSSGHVIIAGSSNTISANSGSNNAAILGGSSNTISGTIGGSTACGVAASITHSNAFVFSDGAAITSSFGNQTFTVGVAGGAIFYSNAARTVGVSLAAGGNAWAAVCDKNLKENMVPLDHHLIMQKIDQIEVYRYNFIGYPKEQWCYGTTAQEWHNHFGSQNINVEICDPETREVTYRSEPAKDPLKIDQGDMMGVILSCVKYLRAEEKILKDEIEDLKNQNNHIEHDMETLRSQNLEIKRLFEAISVN